MSHRSRKAADESTRAKREASSLPRASREKNERTPTVDAAVRECFEMMTADTWITGRSHAELAAKYGVESVTVQRWASEAARMIRFLRGDDADELRARFSL